MPEPKTACRNCGVAILVATANRLDGLCAPCHRARHPHNLEPPLAGEARTRAIEAIRARLHAGCSAEEFAAMRCPVCDGPLSLFTHPHRPIFSTGCVRDTSHMRFDGSAEPPPAWWSAHHQDTGWIMDHSFDGSRVVFRRGLDEPDSAPSEPNQS